MSIKNEAEEAERTLVTRGGTCRYCGQIKVLQVPETFTQEDVDDEVSKMCNCFEARVAQRKEESKAAAEAFMKDAFSDEEHMIEIMKMNFNAVIDDVVEKVSIVRQKIVDFDEDIVETRTYTIKKDKKGFVNIDCKQSYARKEKF